MATTCGFYNAVKQDDGTYDRVYNAEQLGNMFEGIISDGAVSYTHLTLPTN